MDNQQNFPYRIDNRWLVMLRVLGVTDTDGVTISSDGMLRATFGRLRTETPIANIDHTEITGPHRWWTAVGARLSFVDSGLTFGTNHDLGLCIEFVAPIARVLGSKDHQALWVSVADPEALASAINEAQTVAGT